MVKMKFYHFKYWACAVLAGCAAELPHLFSDKGEKTSIFT